jgi:hypothetical protein
MSHWRSQVGVGLAATLLASLLATSLVATALALTITNTNPSVTVPTGVATNVGINYAWNGTASDTPGATSFAVTLPSGYTWTATPTFSLMGAATATVSAPSTVGQVTTWTLSSFSATGPWTLALSGGQVSTSLTSGSSIVTLSYGTTTSVIATLTASGVTTTGLFPVTISPLSVPADGTSTILLVFGTANATCANYTSVTVATTGGTFTTTNLPGVTSPVNGTSATVECANFSSVSLKTLTLRAPTTPGTATITVSVLPVGSTSSTIDSTTVVTFTKTSPGQGKTEREHGKGARKVAFYASTGATTCAAAPVTPSAGTKSFGFAILNTTGHGRVNVEVSLKGAAPNSTYSVYLDQAGTCSLAFTLHTNSRGNGNRHLKLAMVSGATQAWLTAVGPTTLVTNLATVPMKGHGHENGPDDRGNQDNPGRGHGKG